MHETPYDDALPIATTPAVIRVDCLWCGVDFAWNDVADDYFNGKLFKCRACGGLSEWPVLVNGEPCDGSLVGCPVCALDRALLQP